MEVHLPIIQFILNIKMFIHIYGNIELQQKGNTKQTAESRLYSAYWSTINGSVEPFIRFPPYWLNIFGSWPGSRTNICSYSLLFRRDLWRASISAKLANWSRWVNRISLTVQPRMEIMAATEVSWIMLSNISRKIMALTWKNHTLMKARLVHRCELWMPMWLGGGAVTIIVTGLWIIGLSNRWGGIFLTILTFPCFHLWFFCRTTSAGTRNPPLAPLTVDSLTSPRVMKRNWNQLLQL